jgi:hypothetical protein
MMMIIIMMMMMIIIIIERQGTRKGKRLIQIKLFLILHLRIYVFQTAISHKPHNSGL